ncbi:eukaryotic translation initiation factor eIF2A-domain-containing protein [Paraphysoderma sedebokerense]|nr:eukaryotic translation initiation factor eIF2A-domain-containing protein [Paraphysoderma sedebokerense]
MTIDHVAYRTSKFLGVSEGPPSNVPLKGFERQTGSIREFKYSPNGQLLAWVHEDVLKVVDSTSQAIVFSIEKKGIVDMEFSAAGGFICTFERLAKPDPTTGAAHQNVNIYNLKTKSLLTSYSHRNQSNWKPQFTSDDSFLSRLVTSEVQFITTTPTSSSNTSQVSFRLKQENLSTYSLSPGKSPYVAIFVPEKKGAPAIVRLFSLTNLNAPVSSKTFYKADKVRFVWNELGTGVLVLTSTEVDQTGKSYYGENNLYYLAVAGNWDCRVTLDKEGPIHDVAWSPNSKEFVVVYGFMPAKATLFDHRANAIFQFGSSPRNTVLFSPNGRIVCIGGFGNLAGDTDFWDLNPSGSASSGSASSHPKKLSSMQANSSTSFSWSPDGRYLLTATLSPRLRVDNGYKIWHYTGVCVCAEKMDELYQVEWKPRKVENVREKRDLSPAPKGVVIGNGEKDKVVKPMGVYRPPGARGRSVPDVFKREEEGAKVVEKDLATGAVINNDAQLSKAALKNKKKREAKKKSQNDTTETTPSPTSTPKPSTSVSATATTTVDPETFKKIRAVNKKLQQIQVLKERKAKGEQLELTQLKKIEGEDELKRELALLEGK